MIKYTATNNLPLLEILVHMAPDSSKATLRSWIHEGRVQVNGLAITKTNYPVSEGQLITVGAKPLFLKGVVQILYEDQDLVVIDKPEGLLSVAAAFEKEQTAYAFLKERYRRHKVYPVHRLDQDASGVMIFALSERARDELKKIFEAHDITRIYYALVEGQLKGEGTWQSYLYEDDHYYVHTARDSSKGKIAITHYRAIKPTLRWTLLELKLETGRKNQIRVHCQKAGHSIVGDKKYGAHTHFIKRLGLHAAFLSFKHPFTGKQLTFNSPLPQAFTKFVGPDVV
jgi:23S rRNA pseudouridine1911/1915/1917 synthase